MRRDPVRSFGPIPLTLTLAIFSARIASSASAGPSQDHVVFIFNYMREHMSGSLTRPGQSWSYRCPRCFLTVD